VYGANFDPKTATVPEAKVGTPVTASWTVTNRMAAVNGTLGSASDPSADPDLAVYDAGGEVVGQSGGRYVHGRGHGLLGAVGLTRPRTTTTTRTARRR
jgi:hypothetical protein